MLVLSVVAATAMAQNYAGAKPSPSEIKQLKTCEKDYVATKAAYAKKKDPTTKKRYVVATVRYGTAAMTSSVLDRKLKYKKALGLYREALKIDPNNEEAKNNSQMIVSIYKSMGRPVPQ